MKFSHQTRRQNMERLKNESFDLLIIGGGITGAGVARDASSRGLRVALVEAHDFASGTSSRSSKLIHGGIRYLENFEFKLVFEALSERALLFKMAPHLVHSLRFMIPVYKNSRVGLWKLRLGMWLYDSLALFRSPKIHERLSPEATCQRVPSLKSHQLVGALEYSDAYTDDDRLVLESLRGAHGLGAVMAHYLKVKGFVQKGEKIQALQVEDQLTGELFQLKGDQVISCVGPWTDQLGQKHQPRWKNRLRPTKGTHLVFPHHKIPVNRAVVMAVQKRILFVIPRHEMVIVGTTDTDYRQDPGEVLTQPEDVQYILKALGEYFPSLSIQEEDILSAYSGVRPLVEDGSASEGQTSREHQIWSSLENLSFVAGGKYTTYRKISQEAVDFVLSKMSPQKTLGFKPSETKKPLNPRISPLLYEKAQSQIPNWSQEFQTPEQVVAPLVHRYGEEARLILCHIQENSFTKDPEEARWMGEAHFAIEYGMCLNLVDFYWRRSPLFLSHPNHGLPYLKGISKVFQKALGWSDEQTKFQQESLRTQVEKELSWRTCSPH